MEQQELQLIQVAGLCHVHCLAAAQHDIEMIVVRCFAIFQNSTGPRGRRYESSERCIIKHAGKSRDSLGVARSVNVWEQGHLAAFCCFLREWCKTDGGAFAEEEQTCHRRDTNTLFRPQMIDVLIWGGC